MKDFFKTELQTLKAKTGLNQYETFSNMPDASKQIGILLDSMVLACNEFPYIPDIDKCTIIQKMIIQDQDFTALNSRSVWKWLNMHKDIYWSKVQKPVEEVKELPPLTPETEKMIREWQASLIGLDKPRVSFQAEMERIKKEDELRLEGLPIKSESVKYTPSEEVLKLNERKLKAGRDRGLDKLDLRDIKAFDVEGKIIHARNLEEAQEMFIEIYEA